MSQELLDKAVAGCIKNEIPDFSVGDTVNVSVRIIEGEKQRIQVFTGTVLGRKGSGIHETFRVRRIVAGQGVERVFPVHSPKVAGIEVVRSGQTRRAKLYYLRQRVGKSTRLGERRRKSNRPAAQQPKEVRAEAAAEQKSEE